MALPKNTPLFGFEIFKEIELELSKVKDVFSHSKSSDSYNAIVDLCIKVVRDTAEKKRNDLDREFWD